MKIYQVGGAVRDALLGRQARETDWVVVGATAAELTQLGFRPVGKDFPVFLHPDTGEEYALARRERKVAAGYHGFSFDTSAAVTLEEDLARRDLTINAMARDESGAIVDPWGGRADLERRVLRHVSPAFREDPLRVLRVARFAARLTELGFTIAAETVELMAAMVQDGELQALRPERVWLETDRALKEPRPDVYFEALRECGALRIVFPEVDALFGVPQPPRWHPEVDTGTHTLMALRLAARLSDNAAVRFAVLTHDLGKALTPKTLLPRHHGHEERSVEALARLSSRLPVPRRYQELAELVARHHGLVHKAAELRPATVQKLLENVDGLRRAQRFELFLLACEADARGRLGLEAHYYGQADRLRRALAAARTIKRSELAPDLDGTALGEALRMRQAEAIAAALSEVQSA